MPPPARGSRAGRPASGSGMMYRGDHDARRAPSCSSIRARHQLLPVRIEIGGGFVEQPQHGAREQHARERDAPPLARGQRAHRAIRERGGAGARRAPRRFRRRSPHGECRSEYCRFSRAGQITLERRFVPEIGELGMKLVARLARRRAAPGHLPFFGIEQSGDGAQQRGLARAVLAGEQHALPGTRRRSSHRAAHGDRRATGEARRRSACDRHGLVPRAGIEPAWPCDRRILSPLRLPIPPPGPPMYPRECSPSLREARMRNVERRSIARALLSPVPAHYGAGLAKGHLASVRQALADGRRFAGRRTRSFRLASRTPWVRLCRDCDSAEDRTSVATSRSGRSSICAWSRSSVIRPSSSCTREGNWCASQGDLLSASLPPKL